MLLSISYAVGKTIPASDHYHNQSTMITSSPLSQAVHRPYSLPLSHKVSGYPAKAGPISLSLPRGVSERL